MARRGTLWALSIAAAAAAFVIVLTAAAMMANQVMSSWGKVYATDDVGRLPEVDAALVLGTLTHEASGRLNPGLGHRLGAAVELWRSGKVKYLIVSGNFEGDSYDEPTVMRDVLIERGVPAGVIYRDLAGFRTVTSVVRARDIYGQKRLIVVSQRDHLNRAIFLARHLGVEAWGYDARGTAPFMLLRSARSKLVVLYAFWDLVAGPRRATGQRVSIGVDPPG